MLRSDFLPFFFVCIEATEPISRISTLAEIFTVLKGLEMFSSPAITVRFLSLHGSLTFFGVTVIYSGLKSYWVTSEIASTLRTLVSRSSAPISVSF